jgi:uncharacterized protein YjdB
MRLALRRASAGALVALLASNVAAILTLTSCGGSVGGDAGPTTPSTPIPILTTVLVALSGGSVQVGQTVTASASGIDQNGAAISPGAVTWSSGSPAVATVSISGVVTGVAVGSAQITATSASGKQGHATVAVSPAVVVSVDVAPSTANLTVGQTQALTATPRDAAGNPIPGKTVNWTSSDVSALSGTVLGNAATVTALAAATVKVTASVDGVSGVSTVTIAPPGAAIVKSVTLSASSLTLDINQAATITASVRDASGAVIVGKVVQWQTSDASVAGGVVSGNSATIQGFAVGSALVTATSDGIAAQLPVTVRTTAPAPVATVTLSPASASIVVGGALPMVATLRDANGNTITGRPIAWTSSNTSIVSGAASGATAVLTGAAAGTATITATSEGKSGTAQVTIVAAAVPIPLTCVGLAGGQVFAQDGQYLGRLTNQFDAQSILNQFGLYGGQFSSTSMYNQFSQYGGQFAALSAYNQFSTAPPQLFVSGRFAAYVTKNPFKLPGVDPNALRTCSFP